MICYGPPPESKGRRPATKSTAPRIGCPNAWPMVRWARSSVLGRETRSWVESGPPPAGLPPDEQRMRVLGRVKWWRETILKPRLKGESARGGFNGPYFFRLPDHLTRGLWPPPSEAIQAAQHSDDSEVRPDLNGNPWAVAVTGSPPVESVEAVEATGIGTASTVASSGERPSGPNARDESTFTVEAARGTLTPKGDSTASTDSTVHPPTEQAEIASTYSTGGGREVFEL